MKITVREWRKMIDACASPKNKDQIGDITGMSSSSVHKHLNLLPKGWLTVFNDKREGDVQAKHYFVKTRDFTDTEIIRAYQKVHSNYQQSDIMFDKPKTQLERSFDAMERFRDTGKPIKEKEYSAEKSKVMTKTGYIVNGLDGYHSGRIKRARQKTFIGSSENII